MARRAKCEMCPTCSRALPKPRKPCVASLETPWSRFFREAFICLAFSLEEWPGQGAHYRRFTPLDGDRTMRPGILRLGATGGEQTFACDRAARASA